MIDELDELKVIVDDPTKSIIDSIADEIKRTIQESVDWESLKNKITEMIEADSQKINKISSELAEIKKTIECKNNNEQIDAVIKAIRNGGVKWLN